MAFGGSSRGLSVFVNIGGKILPSLNSSASGVEKRFGMMGKRLKLGMAELKAESKAFAKSMAPLASMAAAGGLSFGVKKVIGDGASFMHEVAALRLAGNTAGQVALAIKQAHKTINEVPTSTLVDNLKILRETTGAYGDIKHAMANLSFNQRMGYMMTNVMGMDREESMHALVAGIQALEMRGTANDPARYQREMNKLFQASAFFAGKDGAFTPEALREFSKTGQLPIGGYNERFLTRVLPSLITEVGNGGVIGTQASAFNKWLMGGLGTGNKRAAEYAMKIGLLDTAHPNNLSATGWKAGGVLGTRLAQTDPLQWFETVLIPKLAKSGVNVHDSKALNIAFSTLMTKETAKRFALELSNPNSLKRLHNDEANMNRAMSSEEGYKFMLANDPTAAWAKVMSKLDNLATILGEKVFTAKTIAAIDKFASGIDRLSAFFDKHPAVAKGAVAGMAASAVGATAAIFGAGGLLKGLARGAVGLAGAILAPLGTALLNGLVRFGPLIIRGLMLAFELLSNPIGWGIILVGVVAGLAYYFRGPLMKAWQNGWHSLVTWAKSVDWGSLGMKIADTLTLGLASKFKSGIQRLNSVLPGNNPNAHIGLTTQQTRLLAGARANGGPVRRGLSYLVGERGEEVFTPNTNGRIIPNHHINAMRRHGRNPYDRAGGVHVGELHVHGANGSPAEIEHAVHRALKRVANGQAALLSD